MAAARQSLFLAAVIIQIWSMLLAERSCPGFLPGVQGSAGLVATSRSEVLFGFSFDIRLSHNLVRRCPGGNLSGCYIHACNDDTSASHRSIPDCNSTVSLNIRSWPRSGLFDVVITMKGDCHKEGQSNRLEAWTVVTINVVDNLVTGFSRQFVSTLDDQLRLPTDVELRVQLSQSVKDLEGASVRHRWSFGHDPPTVETWQPALMHRIHKPGCYLATVETSVDQHSSHRTSYNHLAIGIPGVRSPASLFPSSVIEGNITAALQVTSIKDSPPNTLVAASLLLDGWEDVPWDASANITWYINGRASAYSALGGEQVFDVSGLTVINITAHVYLFGCGDPVRLVTRTLVKFEDRSKTLPSMLVAGKETCIYTYLDSSNRIQVGGPPCPVVRSNDSTACLGSSEALLVRGSLLDPLGLSCHVMSHSSMVVYIYDRLYCSNPNEPCRLCFTVLRQGSYVMMIKAWDSVSKVELMTNITVVTADSSHIATRAGIVAGVISGIALIAFCTTILLRRRVSRKRAAASVSEEAFFDFRAGPQSSRVREQVFTSTKPYPVRPFKYGAL